MSRREPEIAFWIQGPVLRLCGQKMVLQFCGVAANSFCSVAVLQLRGQVNVNSDSTKG
jgi:hypothetical protein